MGQYRAAVDVEFLGFAEEGEECYHDVVMYEGEAFDMEVESEEEEVELHLYITDEEDEIVYTDEDAEPGELLSFSPAVDAVYRVWITAISGETEYALRIVEREPESE